MDKELTAFIEKTVKEQIDTLVDRKVKEAIEEQGEQSRAAFVASKGTMDMAYIPLLLAASCAAMDIQASIFFTFYGLNIINKKKNKNLKVPPLANPAMPMPVPNIIGVLPGMTAIATMMMKKWMKDQNVSTIPGFLDICIESGVELIGCQMTMDVMGVKREDLIDEIEVGGAATFLEVASRSNITLLV